MSVGHGRQAAIGLSFLATALTGFAPPIDDPEARIARDLTSTPAVSAIEVRPGGPAFWQVSRSGRTVYVLGVLWDYPPSLKWSSARLEARLRDADAVLTPTRYAEPAAPATAPDLGPPVPDAYRARITAAAAQVRQPAARYLGLPPVLAGYLLAGDFRKSLDHQSGVLAAQALTLARKQRKSEVSMGSVVATPRALTIPTASAEGGITCLEAALAEVEAGPGPMLAAAEGWANGDVAAAVNQPRAVDICSFAIPAESEVRRRAITLQANAIAKALSGTLELPPPRGGVTGGGGIEPKPDKFVAIVGLRSLVAEGGVLDQLRARGFTIKAPASS